MPTCLWALHFDDDGGGGGDDDDDKTVVSRNLLVRLSFHILV